MRRRRRGLSRAVVAELVGRSEEWLRQVERGSRRLDSIEAMVRLAEVLHIDDLRELIVLPSRGALGARPPEDLVVGIRSALTACASGAAGRSAAQSADLLTDAVDAVWRVWRESTHRYSEVAERLPVVLISVAAAGSSRAAPAALAEAYCGAHHLVSSMLIQVAEHHLAWLAADRASIRATGRHTPLAAVSCGYVARCLLALGHQAEALEVVLGALDRLRRPRHDAGALVFGSLCLVAAKCAAAQQDHRRAETVMAMAGEAASRIPTDRTEHNLWFGPTVVAMTSVLVALLLGRTGEAVRRAAELEISDAVPVSYRAPYFIRLAEGYAHRKDDVAAVFALGKAEHACREDLRYNPTARETLSLLLRRNHQLVSDELSRLSRIAGIVE